MTIKAIGYAASSARAKLKPLALERQDPLPNEVQIAVLYCGVCHSDIHQCSRSTPLDSKLTFWCVSYYSGAFGTLWLPYKTQCKTGRSGVKVRAMKSCRNFSQRTDPINPFGRLPHVSVCFVLFGCIWDSLLYYNTKFKTG